MEQKIKQIGIDIGGNIRRVRKEKGIGQTGFVCQCDPPNEEEESTK